jgi:hypothetical protein
MKIRPVGAELFRTDRRMDMTKLTVAFRNFAKAPSNISLKKGRQTLNHMYVRLCTTAKYLPNLTIGGLLEHLV